MLSDMPFCFSLKIMPSCQTWSNALKIATNLMIYGKLFIQRSHLLLICYIDIFLDHIMSF